MNRSAAVTRSLLGYGMVAGPFYLAVGVIQGFVRDGFDFSRHALSHLVNGPGGWVQTVNFALTGAMVLAAAVGIGRVLGPGSRGASRFLTAYGAGILVAAMFPADPVDGFPPGTPEGVPATISTPGLVHFIAAGLGFLSLAIACFVATRTMSRRGERGLARLSLGTGLVVVLGFLGPALGSAGIVGIWIAVVAGWAWLAILSRHLYRVAPDPNC
jgi:hypothetical protein